MPGTGDRAGARVRAVRHEPRALHLHQRHAAGAQPESTGPDPGALRPAEGPRRRRGRPMIVPQIVFWIMAVIAVLGGIGVIASRQPVRSVLSLVAVMLALSVIFLELSAQFVFAVQVIVYAGAVMVLFLFVVALLGPIREGRVTRLHYQVGLSVLVAAVFGGFVYAQLQGIGFRKPDSISLD